MKLIDNAQVDDFEAKVIDWHREEQLISLINWC
jgi:hypothetical protein